VIVALEDEITGALEPLPISSTKHLIWCSGFVTAVYVCLLTADFLGSLRRTEQGRQENVDCGGTA
jgi:undecaprenyl pyrophosphate phosphatase UppP